MHVIIIVSQALEASLFGDLAHSLLADLMLSLWRWSLSVGGMVNNDAEILTMLSS